MKKAGKDEGTDVQKVGESIDLDLLNREQGFGYNIIEDHLKSSDNKKNPLRMIV